MWKKGTVLRKLDSRSYEIEVDNTIYCRNHVHLKKVDEPITLITSAQITQPVLPCEPVVKKPTPQQPSPVAPVSPVKPMELCRREREIR